MAQRSQDMQEHPGAMGLTSCEPLQGSVPTQLSSPQGPLSWVGSTEIHLRWFHLRFEAQPVSASLQFHVLVVSPDTGSFTMPRRQIQ